MATIKIQSSDEDAVWCVPFDGLHKSGSCLKWECSDVFSSEPSVFQADGQRNEMLLFPPSQPKHGPDRCKMSLNRKAWWLLAPWRTLESAAVRNRAEERLINKRAPVFMASYSHTVAAAWNTLQQSTVSLTLQIPGFSFVFITFDNVDVFFSNY